ncbi:hypothetical protein [Melaminivora sp.]|uniref:hypothetical protein n=1 Tax=Melaminivora sp. TaxID=1933032 RepID=UPI0028AC804B|nr:hypothetical protein [Melaminivora sp.]
MYYIERIPITDASFLAGSIAEPAAEEPEWVSGGTYAVGDERSRSGLHRVYRCAAARSPSSTPPSSTPPEQDPAGWVDMRPTRRWLPFGPMLRPDGRLVYQNIPLESTTEDLQYRVRARYASAVALFGLRGGAWRVAVHRPGTAEPLQVRTGSLKEPATGYWDYGFGQRRTRDRVLITDLPIYADAEICITVQGGTGQLRRMVQCEIGRLRFIPGVHWGGVVYGLRRSPKAWTHRRDEPDGSTSVLIYGTGYDMSGTVELSGKQEDNALVQLRALLGRGAAYAPTLATGYAQSLVFGVLKSADVAREGYMHTTADFQIEGLPT